jgi:hypothetical protein
MSTSFGQEVIKFSAITNIRPEKKKVIFLQSMSFII